MIGNDRSRGNSTFFVFAQQILPNFTCVFMHEIHTQHVRDISPICKIWRSDFFRMEEMYRTYFVCISPNISYGNIVGKWQEKTKNVDLPRDLSFLIIAEIVAYVFRILRISYGMFANSSQNFRILDTFAKRSWAGLFYKSSETVLSKKVLPRTFSGKKPWVGLFCKIFGHCELFANIP